MGLTKKQIYLKEILQRKFDSELCTKDEADIIICLLRDNHISTVRLQRDYIYKFEDIFELIT